MLLDQCRKKTGIDLATQPSGGPDLCCAEICLTRNVPRVLLPDPVVHPYRKAPSENIRFIDAHEVVFGTPGFSGVGMEAGNGSAWPLTHPTSDRCFGQGESTHPLRYSIEGDLTVCSIGIALHCLLPQFHW